MATCSSIVNRALRKLGKLGAGRDARQVDAQDALDCLRGLYTSWIASGAFGRLWDVIPGAGVVDYTAHENFRIFRPAGSTWEVTLPDVVERWTYPWPPEYGMWPFWQPYQLNENARTPKDGAVVVVSDADTATTESFIYDGMSKRWQAVDGLVLTDEAPRSYSDAEGLAACLAIEVSDQFGTEVMAGTLASAQRYRQAMTHGYSSPREAAVGVYF
jgi:hypothetical protein